MRKRSKARKCKVQDLSEAPDAQSDEITPKKKRKTDEKEVVLPETEEVTTIHHLKLDCLSHIFSHLSLRDLIRLPEVCKYWKDLDSDAWQDVRELDLISLEKWKNPSSFSPTFSRIDTQEKRTLRFTIGYPKLLSLSGRFIKTLTLPVLYDFNILQIAADECQNLKRIVIRFDVVPDKTKHSEDLKRLFEKNKGTLRSVIIDNMGRNFHGCVDCLLELPEELTELQLWGYTARYKRDAECPRVKWFNRFVPALKRLTKLQILVLNGLRITSNKLAMIQTFDDLRYLEIFRSNAEYSRTFNIDPIASRRKLEYLSLQRVYNMTTDWVGTLVRNNQDLKHLKLQTCTVTPEFIVQLFALPQLETLSLTYLTLRPQSLDLSGFYNLKKFVCTTAGDRAVIQLMDTALELTMMILSKSDHITSQVLNKASQVTDDRTNGVPLHIVVEAPVIRSWRRPAMISALLTVENSWDYCQRTRYGYDDSEEELFY